MVTLGTNAHIYPQTITFFMPFAQKVFPPELLLFSTKRKLKSEHRICVRISLKSIQLEFILMSFCVLES